MKISQVTDWRTFEEAAIEFLANAPSDEVFTLIELSSALGRKFPPTKTWQQLAPYGIKGRVNGRHQWLYGSPAALKALRKQLHTI